MTHQTKLKSFILAAAVSLGLATGAFAQNASATASAPAKDERSGGQLGAAFAGVSLDYLRLDDGPPSAARGFTFTVNQPLNAGFDAKFDYDYAKASAFGVSAHQETALASLVAFETSNWGRSYVQVGAGYAWIRGGGVSDNSFEFLVGVGAEFQAARALTLTPYLNFVRQTGANESRYDLGMKATYRLTKEWDLTAKVQQDFVRHSSDATVFSLGVAYRY